MQTVALRELQQVGLKAIKDSQDLTLIENRGGPVFFLIKAEPENLDEQSRALERAMALASLQNWRKKAAELGLSSMSSEEIGEEIKLSRRKKQ